MEVKFNVKDEFLQELKRDKWCIDRRIVRVTSKRKSTGQMPIHKIFIEATALSSPMNCTPTVIHLIEYIGEIWGGPDQNDSVSQKTIDRAETELQELKEALKTEGFEIRSGVFVEGNNE